MNWAERFSMFMNRSARLGPYGELSQKLHKDEIEEAMAGIDWQIKCRIYNRQVACRHLKGGKARSYASKDYAITTHTRSSTARPV